MTTEDFASTTDIDDDEITDPGAVRWTKRIEKAVGKSVRAEFSTHNEEAKRRHEVILGLVNWSGTVEKRLEDHGGRITSLETHGIPKARLELITDARMLLIVIAIFAGVLVAISAGDLWFRHYAFNHAPVIRAKP